MDLEKLFAEAGARRRTRFSVRRADEFASRRGICELQDDFSVANAAGATVRADINAQLQSLATLSSGTAAPSTTYANQLWIDTTNNLAKKRNNANSSWVTFADKDFTNWQFAGTLLVAGAVTLQSTLGVADLITSTRGNNTQIFTAASATTGYQFIDLVNTSGRAFLGVEGSAGNQLATGTTAYDTVLRGKTGISFSATDGGLVQARLTSAGLGVMLDPVATVSLTVGFDGTAGLGQLYRTSADASGETFVQFQGVGPTTFGSITRNAATSAILYNTTSDYRTKEVYGAFASASEVLGALKIYDGIRKGDSRHQPLVLAHEVQPLMPWAVTGEQDAEDVDGRPMYQQVDFLCWAPMLAAGWQAHDARIRALEAR